MGGETDLTILLATMQPQLHSGEYVFCSITREPTADEVATAIAIVREDEGVTLVLNAVDAMAMGFAGSGSLAWITLSVHSSLEAVGLTSAVAGCLTDIGVACNVVAGFHHDHLFVPADRADDAMAALMALTRA